MQVLTGYKKRALIRRPGYPVGQPAPCFIHCGCGREVDVIESRKPQPCPCGLTYDAAGWIVAEAQATR